MAVADHLRKLIKAKSGADITGINHALFEEFSKEEEIIEKINSIFELQANIMEKWELRSRLIEIENCQLIIPNATESTSYNKVIDFSDPCLENLFERKIEGLEEIGLSFDEETEEELFLMGEKALFIEHPTDDSNRNFKREYGSNLKKYYPWTDLDKTPYTIAGPYLKDLFDLAFIKGLKNPMDRPPAEMWEQALIKTNDLKLRCANSQCEQQWFIYNNTIDTRCPFCNTKYSTSIPVLDFFYQFNDTWKPENLRLVVHNNTTLHIWHSNRSVIRNEKLKPEQKKRVGYCSFHNNKWLFVNENLPDLKDLTEDKEIAIGEMVELTEGKKLHLSKEKDGRVVLISIAYK